MLKERLRLKCWHITHSMAELYMGESRSLRREKTNLETMPGITDTRHRGKAAGWLILSLLYE
jgi:hypothetical protein